MAAEKLSVIMPMFNAALTIDRAVRSVLAQTCDDWELLIIDDCSTDNSCSIVDAYIADDRIKLIRNDTNLGPSAARNRGLRASTGSSITYLDSDDEFYPQFLASVRHFQPKGDVLVFGVDCVDDSGDPQRIVRTHDPSAYARNLFMGNLSSPLGIAHRRSLWERVGGFDETLWCLEDWEFWKRMARSGADFLYLPITSGMYHLREGSRSRAPRLTRSQKSYYLAKHNAVQGQPSDHATAGRGRNRRLLLACPHPVLSHASAWGRSMVDLMLFLAARGFECTVLSGESLDAARPDSCVSLLEGSGLRYYIDRVACGYEELGILKSKCGSDRFALNGVAVDGIGESRTFSDWARAFASQLDRLLSLWRPDVVFTSVGGYAGDALGSVVASLPKRFDLPVVAFDTNNTVYSMSSVYTKLDYYCVNTCFLREYYWNNIGLDACVLPFVMDWNRAFVLRGDPRYLTIVYEQNEASVEMASAIAEQVEARRVGIPVLLVPAESPGVAGTRVPARDAAPEAVPAGEIHNWHLDVTRLMLFVATEGRAFPAAALAAMINGVPVIASARGTLPEILGDSGLLLDLPIGGRTGTFGAATEPSGTINIWLEAVLAVLSDDLFRDSLARGGQARARRWHPDQIGEVYDSFISSITTQPGPPMVPPGTLRTEKGSGFTL